MEPLLTKQWFVDAKKVAKNAIVKVKNKETVFYPENWSKTYFQWMENIEPWCISRQLWWGHQIPAWYTKNNEIIVAENKKEADKIVKKKSVNTQLIRHGNIRSNFNETSESLFLTSGFIYKSAEEAELCFKEKKTKFARNGSP